MLHMEFVSFHAFFNQSSNQADSEIGWGVPFLWAGIWAGISTVWVRRDLYREAEEWEVDKSVTLSDKKEAEP